MKTFVLSSAVLVFNSRFDANLLRFTFFLGEVQMLIFSEAESALVLIFRMIFTMYLLMAMCKLCFIGPPSVKKCDEKIQPKLFPLVTWGREEGSFVQVLAGNRGFLFLTIIDRSRLSGFLIIMMRMIN